MFRVRVSLRNQAFISGYGDSLRTSPLALCHFEHFWDVS